MFKIPEWDSYVPKSNIKFSRKTVKAKSQNLILKTETPINIELTNTKQFPKSANKVNLNTKYKKINQIKNQKNKNKNENSNKIVNEDGNTNKKNNFVSLLKSNITKSNSKNNYQNHKNIENKNVNKIKNKNVNKKKKKNVKFQKSKINKSNEVNKDLSDSTQKHSIDTSVTDSTLKNTTKTRTKKRKSINNSQPDDYVEVSDLNGDKVDEVIINEKRKKLNEQLQNDDQEDILFKESKGKKAKHLKTSKDENINKLEASNYVKIDFKKEKLRKMLQENSLRSRFTVNVRNGNKLRERMLERLKAAQFRYLNEKLYTSSGTEAHQLFQSDPAAFKTYHEGYQQQLKKWPINPLDLIVKRIQKMPKTHKIADMGCGEAALSHCVPHPVRSFDLVATTPSVEVCNIAHTPLLAASMDVAVYSLALMGTELTQYLIEASRILKIGGHLLIAEVESRFEKVEDFTKAVERIGFKLIKLDKSHTVFYFMEFTKIRDAPVKKSKLPALTLKPCLYKRR